MKRTWRFVNEYNLSADDKNKLYIALQIMKHTIIGGAAWLLIGRFYLPELAWLLSFMGYPAVTLGWLGSTLYMYNHEFDNTLKNQ